MVYLFAAVASLWYAFDLKDYCWALPIYCCTSAVPLSCAAAARTIDFFIDLWSTVKIVGVLIFYFSITIP